MTNKTIVWMIVLTLLCVFVSSDYSQTSFTNGLSAENFTYTGSQTITRYIQLPRYANVTGASAFISHNMTEATNLTIEFANQTWLYYQGNGKYNLSVCQWYFEAPEFPYCVPGVPFVQNLYRVIDGNYSTGFTLGTGDLYLNNYNYTIDISQKRAYWQVKDGTSDFFIGINKSCMRSDGKISLYTWTIPTQTRYYCWNDTNWMELKRRSGGTMYEESLVLFNNSVDIIVADDSLNFQKSEFTGNFTTQFRKALSDNCNCTDCTLTSTQCTIPFYFHSDTSGILEVSDIDIDYNYSVRVEVYNQVTEALITGANTHVEFISDDYAIEYYSATSNNTVNLVPGTYTIRYAANGYQERFSYWILDNSTENLIKLYLYPTTGGNAINVTATVYNELGSTQENVAIEYLRYNISTNSFILLGSALTNFEGEANLYLTLNDEFYKFMLYYPIGTLRYTSEPTYITSNEITFNINIQDSFGETFYNIAGIDYSFYYSNTTQKFYFTYSDPNYNSGNEYCLYTYTVTMYGKTLINYSCASSSSGTLITSAAIVNGTTYLSQATVNIDNQDYFIDSRLISFIEQNPFLRSNMGLLIVLIMTLIFVFITTKYTMALILVPIPTIAAAYMQIINIPISVAFGIEIMFLILAIMLNQSK